MPVRLKANEITEMLLLHDNTAFPLSLSTNNPIQDIAVDYYFESA